MNAVRAAGKVIGVVGTAADASVTILEEVAKHGPEVARNVLTALSDSTQAMQYYTASLPETTWITTYLELKKTYGDVVADAYLKRIGKEKPEASIDPQQLRL